MSDNKLTLSTRTLTGKKLAKLRAEGLIPSVIYGGDKDPILGQSLYNPTEKSLKKVGYHSPIDLEIDGKSQMALVKNVDIDPVRRLIRNVQFQAISADEIVEATTPVVIINFESSEASKLHYAALLVLEELDIKAKPANLPSQIEIDASTLTSLEDRLTVADLKLPAGVELANKELSPDQIIVNLFDPAAEAAAREAADKADAEAATTDTPAADTPADAEAAEAK